MNNLNDFIKFTRIWKGIQAKTIAERLGVSKYVVHNIENGKTPINDELRAELFYILDISDAEIEAYNTYTKAVNKL